MSNLTNSNEQTRFTDEHTDPYGHARNTVHTNHGPDRGGKANASAHCGHYRNAHHGQQLDW